MENKILELVVNLILIMTIIINTIIFIKVLQKYIDRNEEKVLKIKRILEIRENL